MEGLIKLAAAGEVSGSVSAWMDAGLCKIAEGEYDEVVNTVADSLPEDYTEEDMENALMAVADEFPPEENAVADGVTDPEVAQEDAVPESEKIAEEGINVNALNAAMGELVFMKQAGEVTDEEFAKEAAGLQGLMSQAAKLPGAVGSAVTAPFRNLAQGLKDIKAGNAVKGAAAQLGSKAKRMGLDTVNATTVAEGGAQRAAAGKRQAIRGALQLGAGAAGAVGTGALGKKLYDRHAAA